jgi:hypothetical protein
MIINNKRVQGLYVYGSDSENVEFTKGDLVVSGGYIYICDAEIVSGIDPAEDTSNEYYRPYPGSKIMSASEYFEYVKSGGGEDKYISSKALMGILQGYQFGLNMEGVITDWIDQNGDTTLILSNITDRPIDNLMLTETLNRGTVKIDWRLKQIVGSEVSGVSFSSLFGFLDKKDSETGRVIDYQLILNQYTYKQNDTLYIRIQELVSPLSGVSIYRYMSWRDGEFPSVGNTISSWRNVFSYSSAIQSKLDVLNQYYVDLENQFRVQVASLRGSFRFREIYIGSTYEGSKKVEGLGEGVYTLCLEGFVVDGTYTESMTVRLKRGMSTYSIHPSKLSGMIRLSFSGTGTVEIVEVVGSVNTKFTSIYKREERG